MIKLLDKATINKIAAGEVIERPFSVIKELVENSIDAGSRKIIIEIKDGGISYIRVTDNGCGIPENEIELAFISHATSKINDIADLNSLYSLGFRGEALASIAAVSQLEITSKTAAQEFGRLLDIFGGEIINSKEVSANIGTAITVRNIFYNTPVRKKFLKSASAETGFISDFVNKIALSRPDVSFRLINNGAEALFTSGNGDLKTAIFCVYGVDFTNKLVATNYTCDGVTVSGFIGKPELSRANRLYEDVIVNSRFVRDKVISKAAEDAYRTYLPSGKFPAFVLNIGINPSDVDVNAHPQKLEVRFSDEQLVYNAVYGGIQQALASVSLIPKMELPGFGEVPAESVAAANMQHTAKDLSYPDTTLRQFYTAKECDTYVLDKPADISFQPVDFEKTVFEALSPVKAEQTEIRKDKLFSDHRIIGQIFQTYWLIEEGGKLFIIDQHAAHERIFYEQIRERLQNGNTVSQTLLMPEKLHLSDREKGIVIENIEYFEKLGFGIEQIENELYLINLPMLLSSPENSKTVKHLIDILSDGFSDTENNIYNIKINTLATLACKAAVKGNDLLSEQEAKAIITELLLLENPFTCPHGRPTIIEITRYELERMFKRA